MTKPTIHLNGTMSADLYDGYTAASDAVRAAIQALAKTGPHGRDYYPQGNGVIFHAVDEHSNRMAMLESVRAELDELACGILEEQLKRVGAIK